MFVDDIKEHPPLDAVAVVAVDCRDEYVGLEAMTARLSVVSRDQTVNEDGGE